LNFTFDESRGFPSVRENLSVLTSRAGFMASTPFSVSQENSIRMAAMCCLTVGGAAWRCKISMYAATWIGSISSTLEKPARRHQSRIGRSPDLHKAEPFQVPVNIADVGPEAVKRFFEFFTVPIRNRNTRAAYYQRTL